MKTQWKATNVSLGGAIITSAVTLVLGIVIGANWNNVFNQFAPYLGFKKTNNVSLNYSSLDNVYNELVSNYNGTLEPSTLLEGAKKGMVAAVGDEYTAYMDKDTAADFLKSLDGNSSGAGIGVVLSKVGDTVRVMRTLPDNPARKAGILAGDVIYKINDIEVWSEDTETIANKLRGEKGSKVKVTILRDGKNEHSFNITRETFNDVSADISYEGSTAIISVYRFSTDTGKKVQGFVDEFDKHGVKSVILDLRSNGGGYVSAARDLLSLWIDGDTVVTTRGRTVSEAKTYAARGKAKLKDMKTIVLVNSTTASASEIVAGALKDYGKAQIVGETTYGKGVVQNMIHLENSTILKVTTAEWFTPKGYTINKSGIKPDIEVKRTFDDINNERDPQMDKAKELVK